MMLNYFFFMKDYSLLWSLEYWFLVYTLENGLAVWNISSFTYLVVFNLVKRYQVTLSYKFCETLHHQHQSPLLFSIILTFL